MTSLNQSLQLTVVPLRGTTASELDRYAQKNQGGNHLKLKAHIFIAVFLSSSLSSVVYAEPPAEVKWLINDPVTLFEWGMYQLNLNVNKTADSLKDGGWPLPDGFRVEFGWADYDWKSNKIKIGFLVKAPSQDSKSITNCKKSWNVLRRRFFLTEGFFYNLNSSNKCITH